MREYVMSFFAVLCTHTHTQTTSASSTILCFFLRFCRLIKDATKTVQRKFNLDEVNLMSVWWLDHKPEWSSTYDCVFLLLLLFSRFFINRSQLKCIRIYYMNSFANFNLLLVEIPIQLQTFTSFLLEIWRLLIYNS